jgi:hypothetical protein
MEASLEMVEHSLHGKWAALEVNADNTPAVQLYESMGFETFETLDHWELNYGLRPSAVARSSGVWPVRRRQPNDASGEIDLIFTRARVGGMAWTQTLSRFDVQGSLFKSLSSYTGYSRYVLPDPAYPNDLLGAIWIETSGWRHTRLSLYLDPGLRDTAGRQALLRYTLNDPDLEGRIIRVETVADDPPVAELLSSAGFRRVRTLTQMRYHFGSL